MVAKSFVAQLVHLGIFNKDIQDSTPFPQLLKYKKEKKKKGTNQRREKLSSMALGNRESTMRACVRCSESLDKGAYTSSLRQR